MRSLDEQMKIITQKAEARRMRRTIIRAAWGNGIGVAACLAMIAAFFIALPRLHVGMAEYDMASYDGYILQNEYVGYVIIGILAFALGVFVTLLCRRLLDLRHGEREQK